MKNLVVCVFLFLFPVAIMAGSGNFFSYTIGEKSRITLKGSTNVASFECVSDSQIPRGYLVADLLPGDNAIFFTDAILGLPVASFDCGNRLMNKDMHQAMGGSNSPTISIKLNEARPLTAVKMPSSGKIRAEVIISINGKTKHTDLVVNYRTNDNLTYTITGIKQLKMSDFGIDPPSPALGIVKVRDQVEIHFDLQVETTQLSSN